MAASGNFERVSHFYCHGEILDIFSEWILELNGTHLVQIFDKISLDFDFLVWNLN